MLGDLLFVIIKEIIKRINDYRSIDNLIKLNKRFKLLIINDNICQEHYLKIRYPKLDTNSNNNNLKGLINALNFRSYSYKFDSKIKREHQEQKFVLFANPKNDNFIIYFRDWFTGFEFTVSDLNLCCIVDNLRKENLKNIEIILNKEKFFLLEFELSRKIINKIFYNTEPRVPLFDNYFINERLDNFINKKFSDILKMI